MENKYLVIGGNIGAGKTVLSTRLGKIHGWKVFLENTDNSFLKDFYHDKPRFALQSQLAFLTNKYNSILQITEEIEHNSAILDRSIEEDAEIFAKNLNEQGILDNHSFSLYNKVYSIIRSKIIQPNLMVYLQANVKTLQQRIKERSRSFEKGLITDPTYLEQLNKRYDSWFKTYKGNKLLIITDNLDFIHNQKDETEIIEKVNYSLIN